METNNLKPTKKRESALSKLVGGSPETQASINEGLKREFNTRLIIGENGEVLEKEKSADLVRGIEAIERYMSPFLREYGVKSLDIRPDQVHFINPEDFTEEARINLFGARTNEVIDNCGGLYDTQKQMILIFKDENKDQRIDVAKTIAHESIHFNSFQSYDVKEDESDNTLNISQRRMGLVTKSGGFVHFNALNEAVTEELALRFARRYFSEVSYTENEARREVEQNESFDYDNGTYINARKRLNSIIEDIYEANKDQFKEKEEVFKIFANAMLQGRLLPLARIYEKTYGRGSFEDLADEMQELR